MEERIYFGTDIYFRQVKPGDVEAFAADMREADRREMKRWTGNTPAYELQRGVDLADVLWVGCYKDGSMMSMFGGKRLNLIEQTGCIWELSTNEVNKHKILFAKASKIGFDMVCKSMPDIELFSNFVDVEYESAVKWIEWLGGYLSVGHQFVGKCGGLFKEFNIYNPYYKKEE